MDQPNPLAHQRISFVKSAIRIAAGVTLMNSAFITTGILFIVAELLGIIEEMV